MSAIANVYASLILKQKKSISDVPENIRDEVASLLAGESTLDE